MMINRMMQHQRDLRFFCFGIGTCCERFFSTLRGGHSESSIRGWIGTRSASLSRSSIVRTSKNIRVKRSRKVSRRERLELVIDSTSRGRSSLKEPTKVDETVRNGGGGESGEKRDVSTGKDGRDIERCSLKREVKDFLELFAEMGFIIYRRRTD